MTRKNVFFSFAAVLALAIVLTAFTQQKADETAIDPVCGMTVAKAEAKATYEHDGKTYYFCATSCKEAFAKDPGTYLKKQAEKKAAAEHSHQMHEEKMHTHMDMHAESETCPLHGGDIEWKVENVEDGVVVKYTSKNPETVKTIQEHMAKMMEMNKKQGKAHSGCPGCPGY